MNDGTDQGDPDAELKTLDVISELSWEAVRAWKRIAGHYPIPEWEHAGENNKLKELWIEHVRWTIDHPTSSIINQYDNWRALCAGTIKDEAGVKLTFPEYGAMEFDLQMPEKILRHIIHAVRG